MVDRGCYYRCYFKGKVILTLVSTNMHEAVVDQSDSLTDKLTLSLTDRGHSLTAAFCRGIFLSWQLRTVSDVILLAWPLGVSLSLN